MTFIPLYKSAFEVVVILFGLGRGLLRLGTIIHIFFLSYANVCRFLKHACMYYTLYKFE